MTRFVTASDKSLWAAVDPDARCDAPAVRERKFAAYLAPFRDEESAVAALLEAGGVIDVIEPARRQR